MAGRAPGPVLGDAAGGAGRAAPAVRSGPVRAARRAAAGRVRGRAVARVVAGTLCSYSQCLRPLINADVCKQSASCGAAS